MDIYRRMAKDISYGGTRDLNDVLYIVFHYTSNKGDTSRNNADYYATSNEKEAGAHYYVDKQGNVAQSVKLNRIAYAVGGKYSTTGGAGTYYKKCTNANSVSIEMCDCCTDTNWEQMKAARQLVQRIRKSCSNAKTIIRHWDVNGKACPAPMIGTNNKKWKRLHCYLENGYQFYAKVTKKAAIRISGKVTSKQIGVAKVGSIVKITKVVGKWGRLKEKDTQGRYRWIALSKVKEA